MIIELFFFSAGLLAGYYIAQRKYNDFIDEISERLIEIREGLENEIKEGEKQ